MKVVTWVVVAPDGSYSVAGGDDHEDAVPDWLGDCGVYDYHCPSVCRVYRLVAEVPEPSIQTVEATATPHDPPAP